MADTTYQLNFTGDQINNLLTRTNNLDTELNNYLLKNGGDMAGAINMNGQSISGLGEPTEDSHAVPKSYADNIAEIANNAKNTADSALPKSGGTMTGSIAMGGNRISTLGDPIYPDNAATKGYVDGKRFTATVTITTTWSGSGPYTQAVPISGILATDTPHIMPVYSTTNSTAIAQKEAWACVSKAETSADAITFTCFEEKPTTAIPIQIEVMR